MIFRILLEKGYDSMFFIPSTNFTWEKDADIILERKRE